MGEADDRTESDGKSLFIIRNGQKIAKYEAGHWVPLLPGVVVPNTQTALRLNGRTKPPVKRSQTAKMLWKTPPAEVQCRWGKSTGKDGFLPVITKGEQ